MEDFERVFTYSLLGFQRHFPYHRMMIVVMMIMMMTTDTSAHVCSSYVPVTTLSTARELLIQWLLQSYGDYCPQFIDEGIGARRG